MSVCVYTYTYTYMLYCTYSEAFISAVEGMYGFPKTRRELYW